MTKMNLELESIEDDQICLDLEEETKNNSSLNKEKPEDHEVISCDKEFDGYLTDAIDETLTMLGEAVKNTLYQNLENNFGISKNDIPEKINEFSEILHKIFGFGASRLEVKIINSLNEKAKANIKVPEYQYPLSKWIIANQSFKENLSRIRENFRAQKNR